jgi:glycine cleavage system regulatory protein
VISDATAANAGSYTCKATNPGGTATSNPAVLTVVSTANPGRLVNISCRATVGTGGNILIAGFAVGGAGTSGTEPLLIRGSGPALVPFGVGGTLPDPQLQLFSGSNVLGTNNGWGGAAAISAAAAAVGAFAWSDPSSHDAALLQSLGEGAYTAQVAGESGDTGVALAEVYDATPAGSYTPASPRIVNISARVQVGTGGNILIAGFAIGGATSKTVLIRASGPALNEFGVTGTLPDPQLQLFSGTTVLQSNTAWGGNAQISSAATAVGAFAWSSGASKDSALLVTLPPGAYTAQVSGAAGDSGVALVEVYEVQ